MLREMLKNLEIIRIEKKVNPRLEITKHLLENAGSPVLFEDVNGWRVVGEPWSTRENIASALNSTVQEITELLIDAMAHPEKTEETRDADFLTHMIKGEEIDLYSLPIPTFYPKDGGPYITAGTIIGEMGGVTNLSFHRMMVAGRNRFAVRLVPRHLYTMHRMTMKKGEELKVSITVGLPPQILLPAAMSVDYGVNELEIASRLMRKTTGTTLKTVKIEHDYPAVPNMAEWVFLGRITHEKIPEGPFVDITGTYDFVREQPVIEIDRIYHRENPLFHIILPGGNEHYLMMGMPREPIIFQAVRRVVPRVMGVRLTEGGCSWLHGVVSIEALKEGDAKNAILAALSAHTSMKQVIIVDHDINIFEDKEIEWAVATRAQPHRDYLIISGARGSSLDPSAEETTSKLGIDATMPLKDRKKFLRAKIK